MKHRTLLFALLGMMMVTYVGCSSKGPVTGCPDEPKWLSRGPGVFPGDKGRALYAVGMADYDANERMQRKVAGQDARVELANQMQVYVASMVKDFMQSHKDFADPSNASSIAFTSAVSKSITESTLYGSQMIDSWRGCDGKKMYMLFTMPVGEALNQAKASVMAKAREKAAETFKAKADEALKELDAEIDKRKQVEGGETK